MIDTSYLDQMRVGIADAYPNAYWLPDLDNMSYQQVALIFERLINTTKIEGEI